MRRYETPAVRERFITLGIMGWVGRGWGGGLQRTFLGHWDAQYLRRLHRIAILEHGNTPDKHGQPNCI